MPCLYGRLLIDLYSIKGYYELTPKVTTDQEEYFLGLEGLAWLDSWEHRAWSLGLLGLCS